MTPHTSHKKLYPHKLTVFVMPEFDFLLCVIIATLIFGVMVKKFNSIVGIK